LITANPSVKQSAFAKDTVKGLLATPKHLSSMYFYDAEGDKLFQQIMHLDEYYLTKAEYNVFESHKQALLERFSPDQKAFELIEFGAGDGLKTKVLLHHFVNQEARFSYRPIDISGHVLQQLQQSLAKELPQVPFAGIEADYFKALEKLNRQGANRKVILFLGSNIGNFEKQDAPDFLRKIANYMLPDDQLLIGIDLKKSPQVILDAYNDAKGVTRQFNLNLLHRINRELDANFKVSDFEHWPVYNPADGSCRSYLVSKKDQTVQIGAMEVEVHFEEAECINMEISQKYSVGEIEALAQKAGFKVEKHFFDQQRYFVDSLWRKA